METVQTPTTTATATASVVTLDEGQLGQIAYHVRWSAALAAEGSLATAAQHAILADVLLEVIGGEPLRTARMALDLPDVAKASYQASAQRAAAMELGFQFVSHFTSDGRHDLADLYLEATRKLGATA